MRLGPTLAMAKEQLKPLGIVIRLKDGEYRVNFRGGTEGTAYYTNDIQDAIDTGRAMAAQRDQEYTYRPVAGRNDYVAVPPLRKQTQQ